MIIYRITNQKNGKIYIGKTISSLERRWKEHLYDAKKRPNYYLHNAINYYGTGSFLIEQIDVASNNEELNEKEKHWINEYSSSQKGIGYNLTTGGDGWDSDTLKRLWQTPEYRTKMINSQKVRWAKPEEREKQSKSHQGKILSEEHKQKLREKKRTPEQRKNISLGKKYITEETRKKLSDKAKARWSLQKEKDKQSERLKNRVFTGEWRKKISLSAKMRAQKKREDKAKK